MATNLQQKKTVAANEGFTELGHIKPFKTAWKIRVKIVHTWKQYTTFTGETIEMILADIKGTLIHATIKKQQLTKFQRLVVFGEWRIIENLQLTRASGKFRATKHPYKMSIMNSTIITRCPSLSNDFYVDPVAFENILAEDVLNEHILIDVLGQVVSVGQIKTSAQNEKPKKRLEIQLRDTSDQRLSCTLWGRFADTMWEECHKQESGIVICLIRCAKLNSYNGNRSVSNAFDMSLMLLNADYTIVDEFMANLPKDNLQIIFEEEDKTNCRLSKDKDDYINQFPLSTISDLLEAETEGKFKIICTVYHIDMEYGWYYFECVKCKGTCYIIPKEENKPISKTKKPLFYCPGCDKEVSKAVSRFKVTVDVMDATGESKFILFDTTALKVLKKTTTQILEGQYDEIADPSCVPEPLPSLVGKTFMFLASALTANITEGKETYKVAYVELGDAKKEVDNTEESELPTDPKDVISIDQDQDAISHENGEGYNTATTTPSSKRKEDPNDVSEQSSTSKKVCLPSITSAIEDASAPAINENEGTVDEIQDNIGEKEKLSN
ncbi:hypothetical protein CARUB_v10015453mg [Capsella rubella]|uniref:Replication factor A C-terminal domain-containing protein n=1 Tax=Capsella rubella TaxID=81985 RepID=R0G968_9BRAS|nr:hypothetical protein CARUB_v10015453mg [Capsella rubella]